MSIAPATEIVVSLMSQHADAQGTRQLHDDPRTYIYKTTNINIPAAINLAVVENSAGVVNLALPFYGTVNNPAMALDDAETDDIVGGLSHAHNYASRNFLLHYDSSRDNYGWGDDWGGADVGHAITSGRSGSSW